MSFGQGHLGVSVNSSRLLAWSSFKEKSSVGNCFIKA